MSLAPRVAAELLRLNRMIEFGNRSLNRNGWRRIGPTQRRILVFLLSLSPDHITLSNLAEGTALSHATASEIVGRLAEKKLIRKARSQNDARVVHLSLSTAGRRKAERVADGNNHLYAAIERLPAREQELILHTLKNIQQAMNPGAKKP